MMHICAFFHIMNPMCFLFRLLCFRFIRKNKTVYLYFFLFGHDYSSYFSYYRDMSFVILILIMSESNNGSNIIFIIKKCEKKCNAYCIVISI